MSWCSFSLRVTLVILIPPFLNSPVHAAQYHLLDLEDGGLICDPVVFCMGYRIFFFSRENVGSKGRMV
jgi:hypothetical protein